MKSLLIVAHGSRREASNNEVRELVERLKRQPAAGQYEYIDVAFLELAYPSIPEGIDTLVNKKASEIMVVPYFLSAGTHVAADIPEQVREKQMEHPEVKMEIATHVGASDAMVKLLLDTAS